MNIRIFLFVSLFYLSNTASLFSQDGNVKIKDQKGIFETSNPYLLYSIPNNGQKGFSLMYGYPGFFSLYGQTTFYYTTSCENSFSIALGMGGEYILLGMNLKVVSFNSSKISINANLGPTGWNTKDEIDFLGSMGVSYFVKNITNNLSCEVSFSMYFNNGYYGAGGLMEVFTADTPYLYGSMINIHFSRKLDKNLYLIYGIGFSFIKYRYIIDNNISRDPPYNGFYITSNFCTGNISGEKLHWDKKYIIPIGVSLMYHF